MLDADGVVQRFPVDFIEKLSLLTPEPDKKTFLDEVFAAEAPYMEGGEGFSDALATVLARWRVTTPVDQALALWTHIDVDEGVLEVVKRLQGRGIKVALATNQQTVRARYMDQVLPYRATFDRCFYSCYLSAAKPQKRFFEAALASLGAAPGEVLFIDDTAANVEAAKQVGIRSEIFPHSAGAEELLKRLSVYGVAP
jgi:putative hydrolase of the HAD superfamily